MKRLLQVEGINVQASHLKLDGMARGKAMNHSQKEFHQVSLDKVSYSWPSGTPAIRQCSFSIPGPGLWMLVGSNGSGKSTLFKLLSGLLKPEFGTLTCSLKVALVFQNPDHQLLLPSCESDLLLSLSQKLNISKKEHIINTALEQVGLAGMQSRPIHTLSGGQKQRLAIAGALVSEAKLLLLDEPTALLDPASQQTILDIVQQLSHRSDNPLTALWITHRLEELDQSDGAARMENGQIGPWQSGNQLRKLLQPLAS